MESTLINSQVSRLLLHFISKFVELFAFNVKAVVIEQLSYILKVSKFVACQVDLCLCVGLGVRDGFR